MTNRQWGGKEGPRGVKVGVLLHPIGEEHCSSDLWAPGLCPRTTALLNFASQQEAFWKFWPSWDSKIGGYFLISETDMYFGGSVCYFIFFFNLSIASHSLPGGKKSHLEGSYRTIIIWKPRCRPAKMVTLIFVDLGDLYWKDGDRKQR